MCFKLSETPKQYMFSIIRGKLSTFHLISFISSSKQFYHFILPVFAQITTTMVSWCLWSLESKLDCEFPANSGPHAENLSNLSQTQNRRKISPSDFWTQIYKNTFWTTRNSNLQFIPHKDYYTENAAQTGMSKSNTCSLCSFHTVGH